MPAVSNRCLPCTSPTSLYNFSCILYVSINILCVSCGLPEPLSLLCDQGLSSPPVACNHQVAKKTSEHCCFPTACPFKVWNRQQFGSFLALYSLRLYYCWCLVELRNLSDAFTDCGRAGLQPVGSEVSRLWSDKQCDHGPSSLEISSK